MKGNQATGIDVTITQSGSRATALGRWARGRGARRPRSAATRYLDRSTAIRSTLTHAGTVPQTQVPACEYTITAEIDGTLTNDALAGQVRYTAADQRRHGLRGDPRLRVDARLQRLAPTAVIEAVPIGPSPLHTDRLMLRELVLDDADAVATRAGDRRVARIWSQVPSPYPIALARRWVASRIDWWAAGRGVTLAIALRRRATHAVRHGQPARVRTAIVAPSSATGSPPTNGGTATPPKRHVRSSSSASIELCARAHLRAGDRRQSGVVSRARQARLRARRGRPAPAHVEGEATARRAALRRSVRRMGQSTNRAMTSCLGPPSVAAVSVSGSACSITK